MTLEHCFGSYPIVDRGKCPLDCRICADSCPTLALSIVSSGAMRLDVGRCLFCHDCVKSCPIGAVRPSPEHRLSVRARHELVLEGQESKQLEPLDSLRRKLFSGSLGVKIVSAGGCGACEVELSATCGGSEALERAGIQFVTSPRHADALLVAGPLPEKMRTALRNAYEAMPGPKLVIAVGTCAVSGGLFFGHPEVLRGIDAVIPVDLYIPGCPPHPRVITDALLGILGL